LSNRERVTQSSAPTERRPHPTALLEAQFNAGFRAMAPPLRWKPATPYSRRISPSGTRLVVRLAISSSAGTGSFSVLPTGSADYRQRIGEALSLGASILSRLEPDQRRIRSTAFMIFAAGNARHLFVTLS
jgi:hypothetical protein